jgi:plastocyanin
VKSNVRRLGLVLLAAGVLSIGLGASALYAQSVTTVVLREFSFAPDRMVVSAGQSSWTLQNAGQFPHNVHVEGNGVAMDVKTDGPVAGGGSFTGSVNLAPGTYQVWCPVGNHREQGMVGMLTVAGAAAGGAAQVPGALPRTGDAESALPLGALAVVGGLALVSLGWYARRRSA